MQVGLGSSTQTGINARRRSNILLGGKLPYIQLCRCC
jgi:hypothetical protein